MRYWVGSKKQLQERGMTDPDKLHEECGVFGVWMPDADTERAPVAQTIYYGLTALQHRGQESAGIVTNSEPSSFSVQKGMGLVTDVFSKEKLVETGGTIGIGHTRYSTAGGKNAVNAQPLMGHTKQGPLAIAHNGNLVNMEIMKELLEEAGSVFRTDSDSEIILNMVARSAVRKGLVEAVWDATQAIQGAYAFTVMSEDCLVGARDRNGIRPMCLGQLGDGYILASESCALDAVNAEFIRDIEPGEIVKIDAEGVNSFRDSERTKTQTCSFEYIYFARPDSVMDGVPVYEMRRKSGQVLARQAPVDADFVAAVPDSGIPAAIGYSEQTGIPYGIALIKNRYVGRSFIKPSQEDRFKTVQVKLNPLVGAVRGKRIILIDDSIVRGTTMRQIVERLRNAEAREVHVRIASPPVAFPCYFGIDTPYREELISSKRDEERVREYIGADSLSFLSLEGLRESLNGRDEYCTGCFSGIYPMGAPRTKTRETVHEV